MNASKGTYWATLIYHILVSELEDLGPQSAEHLHDLEGLSAARRGRMALAPWSHVGLGLGASFVVSYIFWDAARNYKVFGGEGRRSTRDILFRTQD